MKTKSPIKRWVEYLNRHFPKIYRWWISKWKDVKHCSLLEKWKSKLQWAITFHQSESTNNKSWRECGEKGTLLHCWWKRKLMQPIWGTVVGRGCLLWPVYSLGKTLSAFALLHFVLQSQTRLLLQVSWIPTFVFQSAVMKRIFFFLLVLEGFVGHHRTIQLQTVQS